MKTCKQCGQELPQGDRFCVSCGAPVQEAASASEKNVRRIEEDPSPVSPNYSPKLNNTKAGKSAFNTRAILIGLLAIILAAGGWWGWNSFGSSEARVEKKLDLAIKYISENNFEQAVLAYNEVIKIDSKEVKAYQGLAKVYTLQGKFDDAQNTYDQGLKAVSADKQEILLLALAGLFIDKDDYAEAIKRFQQLIEQDKANIDAYRGLALAYQADNKAVEAQAALDQCIRNNPKEYRAYNARAEYYGLSPSQVQYYISKSLELEPNQQEAYAILNKIYNPSKGNSNSWVGAILPSSITNPDIYHMLRLYAYYCDNKFDQALAEYRNNLQNNPANLKARALAAACMYKTGDVTGAAQLIAAIEKDSQYSKIQLDVAFYYSLSNQTDKARAIANAVLAESSLDLGSIQLAVQIFGKDSTDVQLAAVRFMAQQWIPVDLAVQRLTELDVKIAALVPDSSIIAFMKNNYPNLNNIEQSRVIRVDLTGDKVNEIILVCPSDYAFVLQTEGSSFRVLNENNTGHYGYDQPYLDKYNDLYLIGHTGGTGLQVTAVTILRWDGSQLSEIWSGQTKYHNDSGGMKDTLLVDENASFVLSGSTQPEKLTYILHGRYGHYPVYEQQVWDREETVTKEYQFDAGQIKFVETSSKSDVKTLAAPVDSAVGASISEPEKLELLKTAAAYCMANFTHGKEVMLVPPYGNPNIHDYVVGLKEINQDTALLIYGEYATDNGVYLIFKKSPSGTWVFDKVLDPEEEPNIN